MLHGRKLYCDIKPIWNYIRIHHFSGRRVWASCFYREHLSLSPQCGFASIAAGNLLTEDDQWKKLALVVKVARKTWNG